MNTFTKIVEEKVAPPLGKIANMKYIQILQNTFVAFTGLLIIGSLMIMLQQMPITGWRDMIGAETVALLGKITGVGTSYLSLLVSVGITYSTVDWYNKSGNAKKMQPVPAIALSMISFILMTPLVGAFNDAGDSIGSVLPLTYLGATGVFGAILVAIITTEIYVFFIQRNITIRMPEGVPPMIVQAFAAIVPSLVVIVFWWVIRYVIDFNLLQFTLDIFRPLVRAGDNIFVATLLPLLNRGLWAVGIHGSNVVNAVAGLVTAQMTYENQALAEAGKALAWIGSSTFYDNYVYTGLAPCALALILTKSKKLKAIGMLGLLPALFNIGEPLMFGVPIVLNPLLIIPFVLCYVIASILSYILASIGIIPIPFLSVPWTTPAPIKALLSTGMQWSAFFWVLFLWVVIFFCFWPFVKAMEKQELAELEEAKAKGDNL